MAIDWINEPWRKLYTRITGQWLKLSVSARGLANELIKYADAQGVLVEVDADGPGLIVAYMLGAKPREHDRIVEDVNELIKDGYLALDGAILRIRNFGDAQEKRSPHALRQARYRQKQKRDTESSDGVTSTRDACVTQERDASVTHGRDAMSQGNETKRNETKTEYAAGELLEHAESGELGKSENAKQRKLVTRWETFARHVLEALSAARKRINPKAREIRPSYTSLEHIAARLEAGKTVDDCMHVVAVCEDECRRKPEDFQYFDAISPFRPENFERKLARTLNGSRASPGNSAVDDMFKRVGSLRFTD